MLASVCLTLVFSVDAATAAACFDVKARFNLVGGPPNAKGESKIMSTFLRPGLPGMQIANHNDVIVGYAATGADKKSIEFKKPDNSVMARLSVECDLTDDEVLISFDNLCEGSAARVYDKMKRATRECKISRLTSK